MSVSATPAARRGGFGASLAKYGEVARIAFSNRIAYLADALGRPLFFVLILFVFFNLWRQVYGSGRGLVEGFSLAGVLWYMVFTEAILLSMPRLEGKVDVEVKSGSIAYLLIRPCSYIHYHLASFLGEGVPTFVLNLAVGIVMALVLVGPIPVSLAAAPVTLLAIFLAFILNFYVYMCIALAAFWVEDTAPFFWIYSKMLFILGGLMIPLDFYPGWLRTLAEWLPWRLVLWAPARLAVLGDQAGTGGGTGGALSVIGAQVFWIAVFALLAQVVYRAGMKRVTIQGG